MGVAIGCDFKSRHKSTIGVGIQRGVVQRKGASSGLATKNTRNTKNSGRRIGHEVFFNVKTRGTEIDQQAGFDSTGTQITE